MIPVQLTLRNFLSYREETTLDFAAIRIACLAGDNGSGKSALLDAITWAIWGKTRAKDERDVVSIGETEMEVTFVFRLADHEYRVFRRRSFGSRPRPTVEFDVRVAGQNEWTSIGGDNVRDTQARINSTLNMEYETFVNSAFILQGRADTFTQNLPGERKKILGEILNLQEYDRLTELAREELRDTERRLEQTRARIAALDERLATRPALVTELGSTSARLTEISGQLDLAQQTAQMLAVQLTAYQQIQGTIDTARERARREQTTLDRLQAQLDAEYQKRDRVTRLVATADEIERGARELQYWRARAAEFAEKLREVNRLVSIQNAGEREIADVLNDLKRQRDRQIQLRKSAEDQLVLLEQSETRLADLVRANADAEAEIRRLPAVQATIEQQRHERSMLHATNGQLRARIDEIKDSLERLATGDADCPVCRRPLSADHRDHVEETWRSEGRKLKEQHQQNTARMKEIDRELTLLSEEEERLRQIEREIATRSGEVRQIAARLEQRNNLRQQAETASSEIDRIERIIALEDFAHDARLRVADANAALDALQYDALAHQEASDNEQRLAEFQQRKHDLDQARARLEGIEQTIAAITVQERERKVALQAEEAEIVRLEAQLTVAPDIRERAVEASDLVERLMTEKNSLSSELGGIERELTRLDMIQSERDQLDEQVTATSLDHGALKELAEAFGRNGIQAMIVENVLPELEDEANRLLRQMSTGQLQVAFRSQRQALSTDNIIETLDIIIRDEYGERPYALYSGGEAFRVNFAIRVALSKLLTRRAGATVDMLVIDEGFGTQDSRGRDGLVEALRSVEHDFRTILVITHIGEIRELFPTRIDVVKTDRGSRVFVN